MKMTKKIAALILSATMSLSGAGSVFAEMLPAAAPQEIP